MSIKMKQFTIVSIMFALFLPACKTSEENYRRSYESAVAMRQQSEAQADSVAATIHNVILASNKPHPLEVAGFTVMIMEGNAWQVYNADKYLMKRYNVVAGAMKQLFNAKSLCGRLEYGGCHSYIIQDANKNYYVIAEGFDSVENAAQFIADMSSKITFRLPLDQPFVYRTIRL